MFYLPTFGLLGVAGFSVYTILHRWQSARRTRLYTLIDPMSAADALRLVHRLSSARTTSEALTVKLVNLYQRFPPQERSMRELSINQQHLVGSGGRDEFAVCTVYAAMLMSVGETIAGTSAHGIQNSCGRSCEVAVRRLASERLYSAAEPMFCNSPGSNKTV